MTQDEKRIVEWLTDKILSEPRAGWPKWKLFLWVLFNPAKGGKLHGRLVERFEIIAALNRGDHRKD